MQNQKRKAEPFCFPKLIRKGSHHSPPAPPLRSVSKAGSKRRASRAGETRLRRSTSRCSTFSKRYWQQVQVNPPTSQMSCSASARRPQLQLRTLRKDSQVTLPASTIEPMFGRISSFRLATSCARASTANACWSISSRTASQCSLSVPMAKSQEFRTTEVRLLQQISSLLPSSSSFPTRNARYPSIRRAVRLNSGSILSSSNRKSFSSQIRSSRTSPCPLPIWPIWNPLVAKVTAHFSQKVCAVEEASSSWWVARFSGWLRQNYSQGLLSGLDSGSKTGTITSSRPCQLPANQALWLSALAVSCVMLSLVSPFALPYSPSDSCTDLRCRLRSFSVTFIFFSRRSSLTGKYSSWRWSCGSSFSVLLRLLLLLFTATRCSSEDWLYLEWELRLSMGLVVFLWSCLRFMTFLTGDLFSAALLLWCDLVLFSLTFGCIFYLSQTSLSSFRKGSLFLPFCRSGAGRCSGWMNLDGVSLLLCFPRLSIIILNINEYQTCPPTPLSNTRQDTHPLRPPWL